MNIKRPKTGARAARFTIKRGEVGKRLGVSVSKVRSMQQAGEVESQLRDGVHYFDPSEIDRLAQAKADKHSGVRGMSEGKVAAKVFEMLDGGCNRSEIVQTLEITPHKVDALYEAWREPDLEASHQRQKQERQQERERQAWAEHDKRMRELDRELARQQEALLERLKR